MGGFAIFRVICHGKYGDVVLRLTEFLCCSYGLGFEFGGGAVIL